MPTWSRSVDADVRVIDVHGGRVEVVPPRKRVALVGFAASSLHLVPWDDPAVELWGLNQGYANFERRPDRWFEIHLPEDRPEPAEPQYFDELRTLACPVYMVEHDPAFPRSLRYPLERVRDGAPVSLRRYFTSTVTYMLALAIAEGFEAIALYGIDCATGTEYEWQKPAIEAWCSFAMGRGIEVVIPPTSALFKAPYLYGYEKPRTWPRVLKASEAFLRKRIEAYQTRHNETLEQVHRFEGAIQELTSLLDFAEAKGRGVSYPLIEKEGADAERVS